MCQSGSTAVAEKPKVPAPKVPDTSKTVAGVKAADVGEKLNMPPRPASTVPVLAAGASDAEKTEHLFNNVLPDFLRKTKAEHGGSYDAKKKKAIVQNSLFELVGLLASLPAYQGAFMKIFHKDLSKLTSNDLGDGGIRNRCMGAIKQILDEKGIAKDIRPLFLA